MKNFRDILDKDQKLKLKNAMTMSDEDLEYKIREGEFKVQDFVEEPPTLEKQKFSVKADKIALELNRQISYDV